MLFPGTSRSQGPASTSAGLDEDREPGQATERCPYSRFGRLLIVVAERDRTGSLGSALESAGNVEWGNSRPAFVRRPLRPFQEPWVLAAIAIP